MGRTPFNGCRQFYIFRDECCGGPTDGRSGSSESFLKKSRSSCDMHLPGSYLFVRGLTDMHEAHVEKGIQKLQWL